MSGISAMQSGLAGIQSGMSGLHKNAQTIASQTASQTLNTSTGINSTGTKELTDAVIDMKSNQHQVEASAKLISAQDEMLGTLLDEMA